MRHRFANEPRVSVAQNNEVDLADIPDEGVTLVYWFDAMVHFESDVVRSYIHEFRRVMRPGARGFCHCAQNDRNPTGSYQHDPGWRNFMSRPLFEHWVAKAGLRIIGSRCTYQLKLLLDDDNGQCDAVILFQKPSA